MADVTISALGTLTPVVDSIVLPASNGSSTGKVTIANINSLAPVQSVAGRTGTVILTKTDVGLSLVENKSSATIRGELTSSNVTTALAFTPYNSTNPSGYITGITSGNVTTALGFTPYNNTNPNGYIANTNASVAKAWVSFNGKGTTGQNQSIYRSYNVSSVVRDGSNTYTINFTTPMSNTNYAFCGTACGTGVTVTTRDSANATGNPTGISASSLQIATGTGGAGYSSNYISVIVFN